MRTSGGSSRARKPSPRARSSALTSATDSSSVRAAVIAATESVAHASRFAHARAADAWGPGGAAQEESTKLGAMLTQLSMKALNRAVLMSTLQNARVLLASTKPLCNFHKQDFYIRHACQLGRLRCTRPPRCRTGSRCGPA